MDDISDLSEKLGALPGIQYENSIFKEIEREKAS